MQSTPSFDIGDTFSKGLLLLAVLFFSWLIGLKNLVLEWTGTADEAQPSSTPNVLMIVADDLGYDDISAMNSGGLPTPNITQLAQQGVTFRRHYADSTCTPSRVAMLSGRYPERSGFRPVGVEIPTEFPTIAEQLQAAGYSTYLTGKWHAGEGRRAAWPQHKGFDNWFGFLSQFELMGEVTEETMGPERKPTYHNPMLRENGGELLQHQGHLTDILTNHTLQKLKQLQAQRKPWFLYHAFLAPHAPIQPAGRYAEKFPNTPEGKYTALVTQLDDAIGQILGAIDKTNTLVIFVSDNGGTNLQRNNNFPFYGAKNQPLEGAYRTPLIMSWPGVLPRGKSIDDVVMNVDIYPTILAAAHAIPPQNLDGQNLLDLMLHDTPLTVRSRGWEGYSPSINTVNYSLLSTRGEWRLSSRQGVPPNLFHLSENQSGEVDVAREHENTVSTLTSEFWQQHWKKSQIAVTETPGTTEGQSLYTGFDAMRTPYRHGFSIGLEIGPLPLHRNQTDNDTVYILAGQEHSWELQYKPNQGLEWHIGNTVLRDASFDPSRCNAIVLTGYIQPKAHLAKREPESLVKIYSSGTLKDINNGIDIRAFDDNQLHSPTFVNHHGKALFSNMVLSSFSDSYSPRLDTPFAATLKDLYKQQKLSIADVRMMNAQLCQ